MCNKKYKGKKNKTWKRMRRWGIEEKEMESVKRIMRESKYENTYFALLTLKGFFMAREIIIQEMWLLYSVC